MPAPASSPEARPRLRRELVAFQRAVCSAAVIAAVVIMGALLGAAPSAAYWGSSGTGSTTAPVATLLPPTNVTVPASSNSNVTVSWTPSSGALTPTGYVVTRLSGTDAFAACGSSYAAPIAASTCTDTSVPEGTHQYRVTAVYRSWTAAGAVSGTVAVASLRDLTFSSQPSAAVTAGSPIAAFQVQLRTIFGFEVWEAGVPVTISIGANPGSGTLSGTATARTDWSGTATFSGLSINKAGAGYTLIASSAGYAGAVSSNFTVIPAAADKLVLTAGSHLSGPASSAALLGPVTVERQDAYGNAVTAGTTPVSLSSSAAGTGVFAATANGTPAGTVTIPAGSASASFFYGDTKAGTPSLTVTAPGLAAPEPVTATITAAAPAKLVFAAISPDVEKNKPITPAVTVHVLDTFSNPTDALVQVALTSPCSIKGILPLSSPGAVSFPDLEVAGKATGCTLTATSGTLVPATSNAFNAS
ncbi:hypothetical protein ACIQF8_18495 [Pseudarthrobacter sp. NPDC092184]|uniref:hypothetical protein n=1 Tax=unclassified Pseudarthrobacter TaxID=2647000 RepID=UPI0038023803